MRYTKSDWKRSRRLGFSILENGKEIQKRVYGPGQHGLNRRKKISEYGHQLLEKQKLSQLYGINEKQFRRLFLIANTKKNTVTGLAFLRVLESRLDNLVYRMGFANTRKAARQLVNHNHILVNNKKVNIPSYLCSVNDVISIDASKENLEIIKKTMQNTKNKFPTVNVDSNKLIGIFEREVERNELHHNIDENQIIEWYNRHL